MSRSKSVSERKNDGSLKVLPTTNAANVVTENNRDFLENQSNIEPLLSNASAEVGDRSNQLESLKPPMQNLEGIFEFQRRYSKVLMAVIEPGTFSISYANEAFCQLVNLKNNKKTKNNEDVFLGVGIRLHEAFKDGGSNAIEQLYRRHILWQVLKQQYHLDSENLQVLHDSAIATIENSNSEPRLIEFWLDSEQLKITRIDPKVDEFADFNLRLMPTLERETWLTQPQQLEILAKQLRLDNYQIEGFLLLEGLDVTDKERIKRLTELLIDRDSIMQPEKFEQVHQSLRSLFRATDTILLRNEGLEVHLFIGSQDLAKSTQPIIYPKQSLQDSPMMAAAEANRVWYVPDLRREAKTECEQYLKKIGIRSLLLIPLIVNAANADKGYGQAQLLGIVGLASDRPQNFTAVDYKNARELTPAFIAALRQTIQQRFTNIRNTHPAVEWRFVQEAERRSLGLPPETIIFEKVHPLYGISDIRGSSIERNRAIQSDLIEQFQLALAVVENVCEFQETALGDRLREDLLEYIELLKEKVTVDSEVTAVEYLRENLEIYFEFFGQCGQKASSAVAAYRAACDNEYGCVYKQRDRYDNMLNQINSTLQETWERWQKQMQAIVPHYCDLEVTDGIDHMIYVGKSISSKFTDFHLRSLRYDQLRAICDCARAALRLEAESETMLKVAHLVLVQDITMDIYHNESTEKLFDVKGTGDIRYEIVKKRIDKALDKETKERITQTGKLTAIYSTEDEWDEYRQYLRYLAREGWVEDKIEMGMVETLQGVSGLRFARVTVLPEVAKTEVSLQESEPKDRC